MFAPKKLLSSAEFATLLAIMISIIALAIDAILPALGLIARDFQLENPNDAQLVLTSMLFGFAFGQLLAGPLSDSFGRKPIIYIGYGIFIAGCLISVAAESYNWHLAGRVLQGIGASAPRIVAIALVRDLYEGRAMARIMSIVMAIFILVPAIAPAIGQGVIFLSSWRMVYSLFLAMALIALIWFAIRQPETLKKSDQRNFSFGGILAGGMEAMKHRIVVGYTIAAGIIFGAFLGYLNSAQQIFQIAYKTGDMFAIYFGFAALSIGASSAFNSALVVKLGMRYLTWRAVVGLTVLSCGAASFSLFGSDLLPFWVFMVWLLLVFFCLGILFGNFNSMAMEPLGHMAGLGAALIGAVSTFISLPLGWVVGSLFNGNTLPLVLGFALAGLATLFVMRWAESDPNNNQ